jgi:hypothetical protein
MTSPSNIRSKKLLAAARGQSCINCGVNDGTVVAAHYSGMRQHSFGKGRGIKGHDLCVADLCMKCHSAFDNYEVSDLDNKYMRDIDQSEQFLYLVIKTLIRRVNDEVIKL